MRKRVVIICLLLCAALSVLAGCTADNVDQAVTPDAGAGTPQPATVPAANTAVPATEAPADAAAASPDDASDAGKAPADVQITLARTACNGICPVYQVTIYGDGTVIFVGEDFVEMTGEQTGQIEPAAVDALAAAMLEAGYFEMADAYDTVDMTDMPWAMTSLTVDGQTKSIRHYYGDESGPEALRELEELIDQVANTAQWIGEG